MQQTENEYFQKIILNLSNNQITEQKGRKLANKVIEKMQQQIMRSQIELPQQLSTKKLIISKRKEQIEQQTQQSLLRKVQNEKQLLLKKIKDLDQQETQLKTKIRLSPRQEKVHFKSNLTEDDKFTLKNLIKSKKDFQKNIQRKNKQLFQIYKQKSYQQTKQIQEMYQMRKQKRRSQVLENLKFLQSNSNKRKQFLTGTQHKIRRSTDYLYKKNEKREVQQKAEVQIQYRKKLQNIKKQFASNAEEIREHEKKYQQYLRQNQFRIEQKLIENKKKMRSKSYSGNYFQVLAKQKLIQQKRENFDRLNFGHDMKERICKFQQKLNSQFKPKISNESKFKQPTKSMSLHSLSILQQKQKGLQYLEIAKNLKDNTKKAQGQKSNKSPIIQKRQFIDYSKTLKYKQNQDAQSKLNEIIKRKNIFSDFESASMAVGLTKQIQAKSKLSDDKKLLNSVRYKIELLNALD